ncbi:ATP-binding cassette domain-containing protein [Marinobacter sp. CHS3-4]|uniref:ATP-binding cassette domain-containing protein n=1 Tax=Marinobacter sp. CHS3-4 TaxID=3045174 RepID=UPI0024B5D051|nr:ATP-binding cassette domain-containing protein [Marinobacter sp. CHS3-4]MDI9244361.1 ATP-binding cassette domain-containing protein [Marinobacter sp. CHS3-4]
MNDMAISERLLPLQLNDVSFRHRNQTLLQDINLQLGVSGRTVLLGPNGAGKSLLMRLCHGLLDPTSGTVRWALDNRSWADIRQRQAMVFQRPVLLRRSALANIRHALALHGVKRSERNTLAMAALDRFGLASLSARPARVLSGGEQQRLALARAWALQPEILFLDEPTSALDPAAVKAVEDAVAAFQALGTRIVMSTHDMGQARRMADDVVFLLRGRVHEHAPASTFFESPQTPEAAAFIRGELIW